MVSHYNVAAARPSIQLVCPLTREKQASRARVRGQRESDCHTNESGAAASLSHSSVIQTGIVTVKERLAAALA